MVPWLLLLHVVAAAQVVSEGPTRLKNKVVWTPCTLLWQLVAVVPDLLVALFVCSKQQL
jgi:hypothetical protein